MNAEELYYKKINRRCEWSSFTVMECNTSEFHCLNLTSQDLSQLESISAAYFGTCTWEIEEDAEEVNLS